MSDPGNTPTDTAAARFRCEACDKSYRWKPQLAGKQVKCACGHVMTCPSVEPRGDEDGLYGLAPDRDTGAATIGSRHLSSPLATAASTPPALLAAAGAPAVSYERLDVSRIGIDDYFPDRVKDLYAPLILIAGSTVIEVVAAYLHGARLTSRSGIIPAGASSFLAAIMVVGVGMLISTVIMLIGILIAARFRGIHFGPFWTAILKLAAIAIAPDALVTLISPGLNLIPFIGWLIGWLVGFILYFALLGVLFDLDQSDTWYCVCVIFVVKVVLFFAVLFGILSFLR